MLPSTGTYDRFDYTYTPKNPVLVSSSTEDKFNKNNSSTSVDTSNATPMVGLTHDQLMNQYNTGTLDTRKYQDKSNIYSPNGQYIVIQGINEFGKLHEYYIENPNWVDPNKRPNTGGSTGGTSYPGGSGGSVSTTTTPVNATKVDWQGRNVDDVANQLGFTNYKYEDILKLYNDATNAKFNEYDTQTKRAQADNLRTMEAQYENYMNTLRNDRANAVASGITKGTTAATLLGTQYANAQQVSAQQQALEDVLYDLTQQRGTALETNKVTANTERNAFQNYMSGLLGTYEANSVNELAAKLAAQAQVQSAQIGANATTAAAGISAGAASNSANAVNDWYLNRFVENAGGNYAQGLSNYLAYQNNTNNNILANTDYTKYLMGQ